MANDNSVDDLLDFLNHASERGLMPAATTQALAVAVRNVLSVLSHDERDDVARLDIPAVVKRFTTKRAKDFNPSSLKEYGRRVQRAVELFLQWRHDPANFSVTTRATTSAQRKERRGKAEVITTARHDVQTQDAPPSRGGGYQSSLPIRPGTVVTVSNIPNDLTSAEAERLATFVRMLAVD